jgi:phosphopantothenoylcysteine synthetase/decarboxylase
MYFKKITQENIEKLKKHGATVVDPIRGHLVCMDQGMGHLAEIKTLVIAVKRRLSS